MSTTADVALAVGPSIVAVTAVLVTFKQQSRTLKHDQKMRKRAERHDRAMRDLEYQRALMDDVALSLQDGRRALSRLLSAITTYGAGYQVRSPQALPDMAEAADAMRMTLARLILRRGDGDEIVALYQEACEAARNAIINGLPLLPDLSENLRDSAKAVRAAHASFNDATDRFIAAAATVIGTTPKSIAAVQTTTAT